MRSSAGSPRGTGGGFVGGRCTAGVLRWAPGESMRVCSSPLASWVPSASEGCDGSEYASLGSIEIDCVGSRPGIAEIESRERGSRVVMGRSCRPTVERVGGHYGVTYILRSKTRLQQPTVSLGCLPSGVCSLRAVNRYL